MRIKYWEDTIIVTYLLMLNGLANSAAKVLAWFHTKAHVIRVTNSGRRSDISLVFVTSYYYEGLKWRYESFGTVRCCEVLFDGKLQSLLFLNRKRNETMLATNLVRDKLWFPSFLEIIPSITCQKSTNSHKFWMKLSLNAQWLWFT